MSTATANTSQPPQTHRAVSDLAEFVRARYNAREPISIVGGGTALDYGSAPANAHAPVLDVSRFARIVDYTPRDMTILVEAGVRMSDLATTLAAEGQHLPIDVPRAVEATIGGVIATNWTGPRRYGYGTVRDYVIGIHAVDGRGVAFKGGGRVVKNVAGYDFCKLLTGSLGTLAVITQVALKVKPQPEHSQTILAGCANLQIADAALDRLVMLEASPVAIDLLVGKSWDIVCGDQGSVPANPVRIAVRLEGTIEETTWLAERVRTELHKAGAAPFESFTNDDANTLWHAQVEFPDRAPGQVAGANGTPASGNSPLLAKLAVPPSSVTSAVAQLLNVDPNCTIQTHAANGIILAQLSKFTQADLSSILIGRLRPWASRLGGCVQVVRTALEGLTPHLIWGGRTESTILLQRIKNQFDPKNILNPGRYIC
jgi:glycolate oxidase FAD binding subunit